MNPPTGDADVERLLAHSEWLRSLARSLVADASSADDLVQDTWLAAMTNAPDPARPARPWLASVARRLARFRARSEGRRRRRQERAARPERLPSAEEAYERIDTERRLREAVLSLDEPYRRTVVQRYHLGLAAAEIARLEGAPSATVRSRLKRALEELRVRLDERDARDGGSWRSALLLFLELPPPSAGPAIPISSAVFPSATAIPTSVKLAASVVGACLVVAVVHAFLGGAPAPPGLIPSTLPPERPVAVAAGRETSPVPSAEPAERRPVAGRLTRIRIVDLERTPVASAKVAVFRGEEVLLSRETNAEGDVEVATEVAEADVVVRAHGRAPARAVLPLDGGRHEVILGEGAVLSGVLVVDGAEPGVPLDLSVETNRPLLGGDEVPAAVWEALGDPEGGPTAIPVTATESGGFAVAGLAEDWSGRLVLPAGYVSAGRSSSAFDIQAPARDLRFVAHRLPGVTGRVVEPGTGRGVPRARVNAWVGSSAGDLMRGGRADDEGRFRIPIEVERIDSLGVEVSFPDGRARRRVQFEAATPTGPWDVGDVLLASVRDLVLKVTGQRGESLAGAAACPRGAGAGPCEKTDERGLGLLRGLGPEVAKVRVAAIGYGAVDALVPIDPQAPFEVRLLPSNRLDVLLDSTSGGAGLKLALEAPTPPFGSGSWYPDGAHVAAGASKTATGSRAGRDGCSLILESSAPGRFLLCDLRPDVPVVLEVRDTYGTTLWREPLAPMGPSESRTLEVPQIRARDREISGRVLDEEGRPLVRAQVSCTAGRGYNAHGNYALTSGDGRFRFERFFGSRAVMQVEKRGFVAESLPEVEVPPEGRTLEIRLRRARSVLVRVEDEAGRSVQASSVTAILADGAEFGSRALGAGLREVSGLPDEDVDLVAWVAGREYRERHPAAAGEARIVVPVHGAVEVEVAVAVDPQEQTYAVLRPAAAGSTKEQEVLLAGDRASARFETVLPGRCEVLLRAWRPNSAGSPPGNPNGWVDLTAPVGVTVAAGETARVAVRG